MNTENLEKMAALWKICRRADETDDQLKIRIEGKILRSDLARERKHEITGIIYTAISAPNITDIS